MALADLKPPEFEPAYREALKCFDDRFKRDGAEFMDPDEWNAWLEALPEDEFIACTLAYAERIPYDAYN